MKKGFSYSTSLSSSFLTIVTSFWRLGKWFQFFFTEKNAFDSQQGVLCQVVVISSNIPSFCNDSLVLLYKHPHTSSDLTTHTTWMCEMWEMKCQFEKMTKLIVLKSIECTKPSSSNCSCWIWITSVQCYNTNITTKQITNQNLLKYLLTLLMDTISVS